MALIVQEYGGTSVANPERIQNVATRVAKYRADGHQVVVVVSAMSGVTDNLIKMAKSIMPIPSDREMDMLLATGEQTTIALTALALHALNVGAVSLTGAQAGIVTDGVHTKARIQNITPKRIHDLLDAGNVVISEAPTESPNRNQASGGATSMQQPHRRPSATSALRAASSARSFSPATRKAIASLEYPSASRS